MSYVARLLVCLLLLLAGCSTPTRQSPAKERPPDWVLPGAKAPMIPSPPPPLVTTSAPPPVPTPAPEPTWISLDRWAQRHGFGPTRQLAITPVESYGLPTTSGVLVVSVGSRSARWDGLEFRLGFAPLRIEDQVFLHALDVRKNLEPLLRGFSGFTNPGRVIVLDPGHGGGNTGAQSILDGHYEKEFTLDWACRLAILLEQRGWRVFLTRSNDLEVPLPDRVNFAERHKADLFLSLHFNSAAPNKDAAGLETYCLTPAGMSSSLTRGYDDNPTQVFPNNAFDEQNLQCAVHLHRALLAANGNADRGVCRARFLGVLRGQNRPAVLLEGGYLSNPHEAGLIADPAHRQRLAEAVANALTAGPGGANHLSQAGTPTNHFPVPVASPVPASSADDP